MRTPIIERLNARTKKSAGCWEWQGARHSCGYGVLTLPTEPGKRRAVYAHRIAYEAARGEIPPGMLVCHHCDNPGCVNPDHLFLGTKKTNAEDMVAKGRARGRHSKTPSRRWRRH